MNADEFYKLPKDLARADGFVSKTTGEAVKITASGKLIYAYMLSRNEFFTGSLKGQHYESQTTIAESCGLEYKVCGNTLRSFIKHGILEGKKLKPEQGGLPRWYYYKVHTDIKLWVGDVDSFELIEERKEKKIEQKQVAKPTQPVYDWDESDIPF